MSRKTTSMWTWNVAVTLAALGAAGCGARTDLDDGAWEIEADLEPVAPAEPVADPVEEPPATVAPLATCELEPIWWQPDPIHRLTSAVFDVSPSAHVLLRGGEMFGDGFGMLRMSNGEVMTTYSSSRVEGVDAGWGRALERTRDPENGEPVVRVVDAARTRTIFEVPGSSYQRFATLSRDGERVGVAECTTDADGTPTGVTLTLWDVDDAASPVAQTHLPERSCVWYAPDTMHVEVTPSGDALAYVDITRAADDDGLKAPILTRLGEDGSVLEAEVPQDPIEDTRGSYYGVISSLAFTPGGDVSVISAEGARTIFDSDMRVISTERRGAFVSNPDTYMPPLPMSPTAWTRDGALEASTAPDGAVELRGVGGEVVSRLFAPEPSDIAEWNPEATVENAPVMTTFSDDGSMVAVAFRKGVGLWGCQGSLPNAPSSPDRAVELDAPESAQLGEQVPLGIAVSGQAASDWSVYKLIVDGDLRSSWLDPSEIAWSHYVPGLVTIELEVDDGWSTTRSARHVIEITP